MREREGREGGAQQGTCHRSAQIQPGSFGSGDEYTARVKAFTVFFWVYTREVIELSLSLFRVWTTRKIEENNSHDRMIDFLPIRRCSWDRDIFSHAVSTQIILIMLSLPSFLIFSTAVAVPTIPKTYTADVTSATSGTAPVRLALCSNWRNRSALPSQPPSPLYLSKESTFFFQSTHTNQFMALLFLSPTHSFIF